MMKHKIPKPEESTWTDDQWQAITASGQDILVAAAAGSGKTAVLVERIIKKITDLNDPIDVDRLLIVTFTNAAAAEMRKRIGEALEKELTKRPSSLHLRRQLSLLNKASISTLHSFCMEVIRKYYYKIEIDPIFRIADGTEAELLREEVMEELFEEEYSKENNDSFFELVDRYSNDRSDDDLQQLIRQLYDFSRSHPWPDDWLEDVVRNYKVEDIESIDELPWLEHLLKDVQMQVNGLISIADLALTLTQEPGGPVPYAENLDDDIKQLQGILASAGQWTALHEAIQGVSFGKLKSCKKGEADASLQEQVKKLRDKVKKQFDKVKELFSRSPESYLNDLKEMAPAVRTLIDLVKDFSGRFQQVKKEKGIVDFADLEHFCLDLLRLQDSSIENVIPSDVAEDYRQKFNEVLCDEYQDSNLVQETILKLVTNGNNLFMVGDVKQSIYRFRLAEPTLFMTKYKEFGSDVEGNDGLRIDLSKNFRSRAEVLDGTNFIFKQVMNEAVGEINYDENAELKIGASYPKGIDTKAELLLIDREKSNAKKVERQEADEQTLEVDIDDLEAVQAEAKVMVAKIKDLIESKYPILDKNTGQMRNITYRDIVILLRSMPWAPTIMEEFKEQGIPVYAELSTGYFEAIEVKVMMSLLKVIDNPYQDIPLASVLRSPIIGLTEEELATVRIHYKKGNYFDALKAYIADNEGELVKKVSEFVLQLKNWRTQARQGALSDLIWQIFRETGYFDFVGGMPGGKQRQANLRALYDRSRQYEATSFRGLFRFLRFVERMQDRGDDLGTARALGEQEDVVRMMTIHKSKGLEFPIVFVAGVAKQFNMMDLRKKVMLHKELGFASKLVNPKLRISYPTLPLLTIKRRMQMELIAEEMRVLYVALTRAKEKLYMIGSVKDAEKALNDWNQYISHDEWLLPDYERAQAGCYLDWIGPSLVRHTDTSAIRMDSPTLAPDFISNHPTRWEVSIIKASELLNEAKEEEIKEDQLQQAIKEWRPADLSSEFQERVFNQLAWKYPYEHAESKRSKQTVTEIKRQREIIAAHSDDQFTRSFSSPITERPRFMQQKTLTSAEKGTAMHMVMQHVDLTSDITEDIIREQVARMVQNELLTNEQAEVIDYENIVSFFKTDIGQRVIHSKEVKREVPFSLAVPANKAYYNWNTKEQENVLVQGVMDCIVIEEDRILVIDYKTDTIENRFSGGFDEAKTILESRYQVQMELYGQAIEKIFKTDKVQKVLYFFDGGHLLKI